MAGLVRALLAAHLIFAILATGTFWIPVFTPKGGTRHRAAGRWFARLISGAAVTGGWLAVVGLGWPLLMFGGSSGMAPTLVRQLMWLILYFLLLIVTPVQHGLAVVAAGARPLAIRSHLHATLNTCAILGTLLILPASIVWQAWMFLWVAPVGFVVGIRNMLYASRASASRADWQREHLTSLITAGIALHTAFFVLSSVRWPSVFGGGVWRFLPWLVPAAVGLPAIVWLRKSFRMH